NVYIVDDFACTVRQVSEGYIRTIAGRFVGAPANAVCPGSGGDGGPATSADINRPNSVALDSTGRIYITEQSARVIRRVTAPDSEGDGVADRIDNCAFFANPGQANNDAAQHWPWIKDNAGADASSIGCDVCDPDNDNDHCSNGKELGADPMTGGGRDPLNPWD